MVRPLNELYQFAARNPRFAILFRLRFAVTFILAKEDAIRRKRERKKAETKTSTPYSAIVRATGKNTVRRANASTYFIGQSLFRTLL